MELARLVAAVEQVRATSKKSEKIRILADTLRATQAPETALAPVALAAGQVDFADDSFSEPLGGAFFDDADELVAGDTLEAVVAGFEFEIRVADACGDHTNERLAIVRDRNRDVVPKP